MTVAPAAARTAARILAVAGIMIAVACGPVVAGPRRHHRVFCAPVIAEGAGPIRICAPARARR
ncbi:hypothetical protein LOK46_13430 [Methylobacterium sp. NMS14P]|uniref:hypothetical protein n=1 Tax=Methylobacterium sp. NMS14P TaxID=2894310 RepID=UPI002358791A|nr:hypothetical protein [Methylobacterium sp. NMS14P]WCS27776.1 hypothetical protein LOK46_13430 [Methylobacterium sp. NMS14P]